MQQYIVPSFTSSLSADEVVHLMSTTPIPTLVPKAKLDFETDKAAYAASLSHLIVIRDLTTGKDALFSKKPYTKAKHTDAAFGHTWYYPFLYHPLFQGHDTWYSEIPPLPMPSQTDLCTSCRFHFAHNRAYQAIATLLYADDAAIFPPASDAPDRVMIEVLAPPLPSTHATYANLPTPQAKRAALLHKTLAVYAEHQTNVHKQDPSTAAASVTNFQNLVYDSSLSLHADQPRFRFAFTLPATETTAGSAVIPAVLAVLHFLFPALSPDTSTYYDIVQPHQFAYAFRMRNLAGWAVYGGVNMLVSDFPAAYMFEPRMRASSFTYEPTVDTSRFHAHSLAIDTVADRQTTLFHSALNPGFLQKAIPGMPEIPLVPQNLLVSTLRYQPKNVNAIHTGQQYFSLPSANVLSMRIAAPLLADFMTRLQALFTDQKAALDAKLPTYPADVQNAFAQDGGVDSKIRDALTTDDWQLWVFQQGASMILDTLGDSPEPPNLLTQASQNRILRVLHASLLSPLPSKDLSSLSRGDVLLLVLMLYRLCYALAHSLVSTRPLSKLAAHTGEIQGGKFKKGLWNKIKSTKRRGTLDAITLTVPQLLAFFRACLPNTPIASATDILLSSFPGFKADKILLASYIVHKRDTITQALPFLFPPALLGLPDTQAFADIVATAHTFFPEIQRAKQNVPLAVTGSYLKPEDLTDALAYGLFTADKTAFT